MIFAGVADTHTALWFLYGDPRLSATARDFIVEVARSGKKVAVSSISLVEVVYLVEKGRVVKEALEELSRVLADPNQVFEEVAVTSVTAQTMRLISRIEVPDMPDRIISATALHLGVPAISKDGKIRTSSIQTLW